MERRFCQKGFIPIHLIIGGIVLIALAGGAYYFTKTSTPKIKLQKATPAKQTSKTQSTTLPSPTFSGSQPSTPSSSISTNTTPTPQTVIFEIKNDVTINFTVCQPITERLKITPGNLTYEIKGKQGNHCLLDYQVGESTPSTQLAYKCKVPTEEGLIVFKNSKDSISFDTIQRYCSKK